MTCLINRGLSLQRLFKDWWHVFVCNVRRWEISFLFVQTKMVLFKSFHHQWTFPSCCFKRFYLLSQYPWLCDFLAVYFTFSFPWLMIDKHHNTKLVEQSGWGKYTTYLYSATECLNWVFYDCFCKTKKTKAISDEEKHSYLKRLKLPKGVPHQVHIIRTSILSILKDLCHV